MSPAEEKLLRTLASRGPTTRAASKADADTVQRLLRQQLIEELGPSRKGASTRLILTPAGLATVESIAPAKVTLADLARELASLRQEVAELKALVARLFVEAPEEGSAQSPAPLSLDAFGQRVLDTVASLDREERLGGLVPLPRLRDALANLAMSRDAFDDALLALEEQFLIDLKVANEPSRLADPNEGIDTPDRGLLYFLVAR
jgi:hypothetical protein